MKLLKEMFTIISAARIKETLSNLSVTEAVEKFVEEKYQTSDDVLTPPMISLTVSYTSM